MMPMAAAGPKCEKLTVSICRNSRHCSRRWHGRKVADNGHWLPGGHGATRFVTPLNCVMTEPLMSFRGVLPMCSLLVRALLDILSG